MFRMIARRSVLSLAALACSMGLLTAGASAPAFAHSPTLLCQSPVRTLLDRKSVMIPTGETLTATLYRLTDQIIPSYICSYQAQATLTNSAGTNKVTATLSTHGCAGFDRSSAQSKDVGALGNTRVYSKRETPGLNNSTFFAVASAPGMSVETGCMR